MNVNMNDNNMNNKNNIYGSSNTIYINNLIFGVRLIMIKINKIKDNNKEKKEI